MAGGDSRLAQVPMKPFTKFAQGGMSEQLRSFKPTAGGLLAGTQKALMAQKQNPKCFYCGQNHWSDECGKFVTLQSWKGKLRNCCFKCLQRGHMLKDCRRNRQCTHCGRLSHPRSLCLKLFGNGDENSTASSEGRFDNTETQTVSGVVDDEKTMLTSTNQVLMQTATSTIWNTSGDKSLKVRMILDSGSQRTYVTERLAKDLCLNISPPEKLTVVTFGTENPRHLQYKPSSLQLVLKDGKVMH